MIDEFVNKVEKETEQLERDLYDEIMAVIVGLLFVDGKAVFNSKNISLVGKIDNAFITFNKNSQLPFLKRITTHLRGLDKFYVDYFDSLGLDAKSFKGFDALMTRMENYLQSVSVLEPVKQQVKNYLLGSISSHRSMGTIRLGMRDILGLKDRSGVLNRYYRNFLYDSVMQFDAILSSAHAEQNGLKYFIYAGGLISTSREFCIKRNDLVFNKDNIDDWKNDSTLPGYPNVDDYNPLIDRGRWGCRHYPLFITDERAKEELKKK